MANWDDGYVTDIPYTAGYHREMGPVWIATAATLNGVVPPDLSRPFRHADLGCGHGVTSLVSAAAMPHAEFWGFDFNPAHIAAARDIARCAGLTNVHFEEASFEELAALPAGALPKFDYITGHGVLSWVSDQNRRRLFDVIGQRLAPGGIAYLSYNVGTGWPGMPPVQALMRLLSEANPSPISVSVAGVFEPLAKMRDAGAAMFQVHPALERRLADLRAQDPDYVVHELLNGHWCPLMFQTVAPAMAAVKCDYAGSASLLENLDGFTVPAPMREMFAQILDVGLRETVRDLACAASFRRDLYQRGTRRASPREHRRRVDAVGLARTLMPVPDPMKIATPLGTQIVDHPPVRALLDILQDGPATIGALRQYPMLAALADGGLIEAVMLLMTGGFLAPLAPALNEGPDAAERLSLDAAERLSLDAAERLSLDAAERLSLDAAERLNRVHAELHAEGYTRPFVVCPILGGAQQIDAIDFTAFDCLRAGHGTDEQSLVEAMLARLAESGRALVHEGQTVTDPDAAREAMRRHTRAFLHNRLPVYRRLGVWDRGYRHTPNTPELPTEAS